MVIWLVLWNHGMDYDFPLGISSSQLTFAYFFRGVGIPPTRKTHGNDETSWGYHQWWSVLSLKTCIFFHEGVESSNLRIWQTCRFVDPQKLGCQPRTGDSGAAIAIDIRMSLTRMNGMGNCSVSLSPNLYLCKGSFWIDSRFDFHIATQKYLQTPLVREKHNGPSENLLVCSKVYLGVPENVIYHDIPQKQRSFIEKTTIHYGIHGFFPTFSGAKAIDSYRFELHRPGGTTLFPKAVWGGSKQPYHNWLSHRSTGGSPKWLTPEYFAFVEGGYNWYNTLRFNWQTTK